jgi:hypothetical protein
MGALRSYDESRAFENRRGCRPLRFDHDGREQPGHPDGGNRE